MARWKLIAGGVLAVLVLFAGLYGWWSLDLRWRPKHITRHQAEITKLLETAGWTSSGGTNKLYMISFRSCTDCIRFETEEFPGLQKAGVDTRVIVVARRDLNGVEKSTATERATVAQLWITRDWNLFKAWNVGAPEAWKATGIPPADGDMARTAVVEAGRKMVDDLTPMLKQNGVEFAYPLLVWWTRDGEMHGCACEKRETYGRVRKELGA